MRLMGTEAEAEVVGVAADSKARSLRDRPSPRVYIAHSQSSAAGIGSRMTLLIRSEVGTQDTLGGLRHAALRLDPNVPLYAAGSLEAHLGSTLIQERLSATLLGVVAEGVRLALIGIVVGILGAWGGSRLLSGFLFGVESTDVGTYTMVAGVMAAVALSPAVCRL